MELFVKTLQELTPEELFEIYKLRVSVFVVEQKCPYQEVDDADKVALKRRCGLGTKILDAGIQVAKEKLHAESLTIEAQVYARKLYENAGFVQVSDEFLEDGIPHIKMRLTL